MHFCIHATTLLLLALGPGSATPSHRAISRVTSAHLASQSTPPQRVNVVNLPASRGQLIGTGAAASRRQLIGTGAAACVFGQTSLTWAAPSLEMERRTMTRLEAVTETLSRVPAFVVTDARGSPYLTELDADGRRSGAVFLGLREAAKLLEELRPFDGNATLAVVPLASLYLDVSKSASEAKAARDALPQPTGKPVSRDMRLFRLQPLSDET